MSSENTKPKRIAERIVLDPSPLTITKFEELERFCGRLGQHAHSIGATCCGGHYLMHVTYYDGFLSVDCSKCGATAAIVVVAP